MKTVYVIEWVDPDDLHALASELAEGLRAGPPGREGRIERMPRTVSERLRRIIRDQYGDLMFRSHKSAGAQRVNGGYEHQDVCVSLKGV